MKIAISGVPTFTNQLAKHMSQMSKKDKKRFEQCVNCKCLSTCTREEESEDENGMCKYYKEIDKKDIKNFAEILDDLTKNKGE